MKRDMDLVRALLLEIEADEKPDMSRWSEEQRLYHMVLLIEANLVHGATVENEVGEPAAAHAIRLTWNGHEFLDAARDSTIWSKAKQQLSRVGGAVTLPILSALLTQFLKDQLGMK